MPLIDCVLNSIVCARSRWITPKQPDADASQLRAIQQHLRTHPDIKYVWFDFWSMPQNEQPSLCERVAAFCSIGDGTGRERTPQRRGGRARRESDTRSPAELLQFRWGLKNVNLCVAPKLERV